MRLFSSAKVTFRFTILSHNSFDAFAMYLTEQLYQLMIYCMGTILIELLLLSITHHVLVDVTILSWENLQYNIL